MQDTLYRLLVAEAQDLKITPELLSHLCHAVWVDYLRQQMRRAEREGLLQDGDCCVSWEAQVIVSIDLSQCLGRLTASERQAGAMALGGGRDLRGDWRKAGHP